MDFLQKILSVSNSGNSRNRNPFLPILQKEVSDSSINLKKQAAKLGLMAKIIHSDSKIEESEVKIFIEKIAIYLKLNAERASMISKKLLAIDDIDLEMMYLGKEFNQHSESTERKEFLADLFQMAHADEEYAMLEEKDIRVISKHLFLQHKDFVEERQAAKKRKKEK